MIADDPQSDRRDRVQALHREHWFDRFDDAGDDVRDPVDDFRQRMWHAMSLLAGDEAHARRANAMLRHLLPRQPDHFWASGVTSILARFGDRLDDDLREGLRRNLSAVLAREAEQRFRGYNDNFPAMAALSAIVGGELCGDKQAVAGGLANLESLRRLLTRRGCLTEYASPTYSAITLTCLAEIVELSSKDTACELALAGEHRVWIELASRFHPGTSSVAGPHSRAYMVDMVAHVHNAHVAMYQAFGEAVFVNPVTCMFSPVEGQAIHGGSGLGMGHGAWQTVPTYHPPPAAIELALDKPLPITVRADTEQAGFPRNVWEPRPHPDTPYAEFAAGPAHLVTHLTEDYALGTASRVCMDGYQCTPFHLAYRRRRPTEQRPARLQDVATLFARYLQRDIEPNRHRHLSDEGRYITAQHESTAVVAAWPKLGWGSTPANPDATESPTDTLKLSLMIPAFWGGPDEVWLGDAPCDQWAGEAAAPASVYVKDGPVMLAVHPLSIDAAGDGHRSGGGVRLCTAGGFCMIDLVNYAGPARGFETGELLTLRNGFAVEVAAVGDDLDFAAFRRIHSAPQITDRYDWPDGMRYVSYIREGLSFELAFSPISEGIKYREVNGRLAPAPRLDIPGHHADTLAWNHA